MRSCLSLVLFLGFLLGPAQGKQKSEIAFCNLALPDSVKQAHASFNVIYSFALSEDGKPVEIKKIRNDYVAEGEIISCLTDWRFQGFRKGARMLVSFRWEHGRGWVEVSVSSKKFVQVMKIKEGNGCP